MYLNINIYTPSSKFSQAASFLTRIAEVSRSSTDYANNVFVIYFCLSKKITRYCCRLRNRTLAFIYIIIHYALSTLEFDDEWPDLLEASLIKFK